MAVTLANIKTILDQKRFTSDTVVLDIGVAGEQAINDTMLEVKSASNIGGYPHHWDFDIRRASITHYQDAEVNAAPTDFYAVQDLVARTAGTYVFRFLEPDTAQRLAAGGNLGDYFAIERRDGANYIRVSYQHAVGEATDLDKANDVTDWNADTAASDALAPTKDEQMFIRHSASVNFDVDVSASVNNRATIYNDNLSVNASEYEDDSAIVVDVFIPDVTNFTSVDLYWGSDASSTPAAKANYWEVTGTTTTASGESFRAGWNKVAFDWDGATKTASPDSANIRYLEFRVNYGAGQADDTDFRVNNFRLNKPEELDLYYYTTSIAKNAAGTYQTDEIVDDTDEPV